MASEDFQQVNEVEKVCIFKNCKISCTNRQLVS